MIFKKLTPFNWNRGKCEFSTEQLIICIFQLQEKKERERKEELEKLSKSVDGQRLGNGSKANKGSGPSLRPGM
jgi:hypothetical protein